MTIAFRPLVATDLDAVAALSAAVGWPHRRDDLEPMLELGRGLAASDDVTGKIAGVGLWWPWGNTVATLGMMIIAPGHQRRGIGRTVFESLLSELDARPTMLIATEQGAPLYAQYDFRAVGSCFQYQGQYRYAPRTDQRIRLATPKDLPTLERLDAAAFGGSRRELMLRLCALGDVSLIIEHDDPCGFIVARRFGLGTLLGPIVAPDEESAIALYRSAAGPGFVRADVPGNAAALAQSLAGAGLECVSRPVAMVRGQWPARSASLRTFALASQALC